MIKRADEVSGGVITKIINFFKQLPGKIWNAIVGAVTKIADWGNRMKDKAANAVKSLISSVITFFKQLPNKIWNAIIGAVNKISSWGSQMLSKAKSAVSKVVSGIIEKFKSLPSKLTSVGKDVVKGLWNGISNMTSWVKDKIRGFGDSVLNGLKDFFGIKSPSRLMRDQVGRFIAEGIGVGITANADEPLDALQDIGDELAAQEFDINGATINRKLNTTFATASADNGLTFADIADKLDGIYDRLGRLQMITDTGALVGEMIDKIDSGLATRQALSARGV
jgi:phage-related protein